MWPPHFLMNFGNSSYSVTYRNICKDFVTNLSSNRDAKHYEFRTIKILTYQYLVPIVSLHITNPNKVPQIPPNKLTKEKVYKFFHRFSVHSRSTGFKIGKTNTVSL